MTAALPLQDRPVTLTVRQPNLSPAPDETLFFIDNSPYISLLMAAFSVTLPEGERFFIQAVRQFQSQIEDPVLQAEVRAFIGQEAHHGTEHERMNTFFALQGLDIDNLKKRMQAQVFGWKFNNSPKQQLAMTVCIEHFTALMSDFAMRVNPDMIDKMSGNMKKLWAWHIIEEAEHKGVCFDVYQQTVNEPWRLRLTMMLVTAHMLTFNGANTLSLIKQAGVPRTWKNMSNLASFLFGKRGMLSGTLSHYLAFYRSGFHPWNYDCRPELAAWRARFLDESGDKLA